MYSVHSYKIGFVLLVPALSALLTTLVFISYFSQSSNESAYVILAREQHSIVNQLLAQISNSTNIARNDKLTKQFESTFALLRNGGNFNNSTIPSAPLEIQKALKITEQAWNQYKSVRSDAEESKLIAANHLTFAVDQVLKTTHKRQKFIKKDLLISLLAVLIIDGCLLLFGIFVLVSYLRESGLISKKIQSDFNQLNKLLALSVSLSGNPPEIFCAIVNMIGELFKVRVICIAEIKDDKLNFIGLKLDGEILTSTRQFSISTVTQNVKPDPYDLPITEFILQLSPQSVFLNNKNLFSHCFIPSQNQDTTFVTCLIDDKPQHFTPQDMEILKLIGQRINLEMQRKTTTIVHAKTVHGDHSTSMAESLNDWVWETDKFGVFVYSNWKIKDVIGYQTQEYIGQSLWGKLDQDHAENIKKIFMHLAQNNLPITELVFETRHANGQLIVLEANANPLFDAEGHLYGYRGINRNVTNRVRIEKILTKMSTEVSLHTGDLFFQSLTNHLVTTLEVNFAFVAEITNYNVTNCHTISVCYKGKQMENFEYELQGTPCNNVIEEGLCFYSGNAQQLFPEDLMLVDMGIQSYLGAPLFDTSGRVLGIVAVMDSKPFVDVSLIQSVFKLFAHRAAAELERKRVDEHLHYLSHYDGLTGLPNRSLFGDRLNQALVKAHRFNHIVALFILDLDRFKVINDTLGHETGDKLLQDVAERLTHTIYEHDTIARLGGDEFVLVISELDIQENVHQVAKKVLSELEKPFHIKDHELFITTSIGISLFPKSGWDAQTLIKHADIAMYHAKERGKNKYEIYNPSMNTMAIERLGLEHGLRYALERHEFSLYYQPIIDIESGTVIAIEALLRWNHPELGMVSPSVFIPLLEETGLIIPIGKWIIDQACKDNRKLQDMGFPNLRVSVNLSVQQFKDKHLIQSISQILNHHQLNSQWLEMEITESILLEHETNTLNTLKTLNQMGINLAIDDFGTGYSSLSYLKRFPIHTLKIDQSFVHDVTADPDNQAIIKAMIAMAHSLKLRIIAEGVETVEQLHFLAKHKCHEVQGFYFCKPLPLDQLIVLMKKDRHLKYKIEPTIKLSTGKSKILV